MPLVVLHEGLAQVEDGRRPKPHEDRRLAPARVVECQRDQDGDERPADVDPLSAVQGLPPCCGFVGVYSVADPANPGIVAQAKFGEQPFHALG